MSLVCIETGRHFDAREALYAATRADLRTYSAVSADVLNTIPESLRGSEPAPDGEGLDIHRAWSTANGSGGCTLRGFTLDVFLYSLSEETVQKYLPNLAQTLGMVRV